MATAATAPATRKYRCGLSVEEADRMREAALRRASRAEGVILANAEVDALAKKIGRLVVALETYAGDKSEMAREYVELACQMKRLNDWIVRQEV